MTKASTLHHHAAIHASATVPSLCLWHFSSDLMSLAVLRLQHSIEQQQQQQQHQSAVGMSGSHTKDPVAHLNLAHSGHPVLPIALAEMAAVQ